MTRITHHNDGGIPGFIYDEIQQRFDDGDFTQVQPSTYITQTRDGGEFVGQATGRVEEEDEVEIQWQPNDGDEFEIYALHTPKY